MRVLLIDGGQSGSRARYQETPDVKQRDAAPGVSVFAAPPRAPARARRRTERRGPGLPRHRRDYGALRVLLDGRVDLVAAGLTGFDGGATAVARALGVPVVVSNDAVTAHLGALGGEPGVVIVAGTGAIALAVGADGRWSRADGYGNRLGDDGGGYWVGRRGLAAALRARDGRPGSSSELLRRAEARFGERIVPAVYDADDPVAVVADFARDVADAARAGDEPAAAIWSDAAHELAATALAAAAALAGPAPADVARPARKRAPARSRKRTAAAPVISYAGGLFAAGELLLAPLRTGLPDLRAPLGDPLDGAARLLERPPRFKDLIFEAGAP
jgi:N-acetylglucosamine kinase-like BadF-type ATPase